MEETMKIQSLKFSSDNPGAPVQCRIEIKTSADFDIMKEGVLPMVYLVERGSLDWLRQFKDAIIDRGTKDERSGLARHLVGKGQDKILMIDANYVESGKAGGGIRVLLSNAKQVGERNLYIIGTDEHIFSTLWAKAGNPKGSGSPRQRQTRCMDPSFKSDDASYYSLFTELLGSCRIPQDLRESYVGDSWEVQLIRILISLAAKHDEPVLILGDTGTGKEVVARQIHDQSGRKDKTFIPVNCGGIPLELFESELFGHEKGSFTHAIFQKKGLWEVAGDGTLFLDEIGDLRIDHQVKILRALENGKIRRVGGTEEIRVNARVVAATNRDLFSLVQAGQFREDLYYRLRGFLIRTPTLRGHPDDIPLLAQFFWKTITNDERKKLPREILNELKTYRWPGNARELKMVLHNLRNLFGTDGLRVKHLRTVFYLQGQSPTIHESPIAESEIIIHRAECLRHLKNAEDVVRTAQFTIQSFAGDPRGDDGSHSSVLKSLSLRLNEIEMLCRHPLLFHREVAFSVVTEFRSRLSYFLAMLKENAQEAKTYAHGTLVKESEQVLSAVFKEVEKLLESA
jgi:transcriptional regulator with AAA-type ATPase domain